MRFQDYVSRERLVRLGLRIGKALPRGAGYGLARAIAAGITICRPQVYHTVRQNLYQVLGRRADRALLHRLTTQVFYHAWQSYYDFSRALEMSPEQHRQMMHLPAEFVQHALAAAHSGHGLLMMGPHMSNFNLLALALSSLGVPIQLLSLANPSAAFRFWNHLLERGNLTVTPISPSSLRQAIHSLTQGGIVFTGGELPTAGDENAVQFFGRTAYLPSGPVRIAMMTGAPVVVGCCHFDGNGRYTLKASAPIELQRTGNKKRDISCNVQQLVGMMEDLIGECPEQWLMFHPVWKDSPGELA